MKQWGIAPVGRRAPAVEKTGGRQRERAGANAGLPTRKRGEGPQQLDDDLKHLRAAIDAAGPAGAFMNAASPGVMALFQPNRHYPTQDDYLEALAEAMRPEYEAIVAAGLILQLDSPDLGLGRHMMYKVRSDAEYLGLIGRHVEVLNHALRNVAADRVRMHVRWGITRARTTRTSRCASSCRH